MSRRRGHARRARTARRKPHGAVTTSGAPRAWLGEGPDVCLYATLPVLGLQPCPVGWSSDRDRDRQRHLAESEAWQSPEMPRVSYCVGGCGAVCVFRAHPQTLATRLEVAPRSASVMSPQFSMRRREQSLLTMTGPSSGRATLSPSLSGTPRAPGCTSGSASRGDGDGDARAAAAHASRAHAHAHAAAAATGMRGAAGGPRRPRRARIGRPRCLPRRGSEERQGKAAGPALARCWPRGTRLALAGCRPAPPRRRARI